LSVDTVQLNLTRLKGLPSRYLNARIRVAGDISPGETGYHVAKVYMMVDSISASDLGELRPAFVLACARRAEGPANGARRVARTRPFE